MSQQYTTGELAKLCGVTVRTVQYYDTRGILIPSDFSEGGRRIYSEDDLRRLKIICFLRELGIPIDTIGKLFAEEHPENTISLLIEQQEGELREALAAQQEKLDKLAELKRGLRDIRQFSLEALGDIALIMENKKSLRKLHTVMLLTGIPMTLWEIASLFYGILGKVWWPFALYWVAVIPYAVILSRYYFRRVAYICPECHQVFRPVFREAFFAAHTPRTRKLTCTHCGSKGYCVEVYQEAEP